MTTYTAPASIIIVGSGVFGLSTALSLSLRPKFSNTRITILDKSSFPASDAASVDNGRIIRADYVDALYRTLTRDAQVFWRGQDAPTSPFGGQLGTVSQYRDVPVVEIANDQEGVEAIIGGIEGELEGDFGDSIKKLNGNDEIKEVCGVDGVTGQGGYVNYDCGWANATAALQYLREILGARPNITFLTAEVQELIYTDSESRVIGVRLIGGEEVQGELTILAAGAWTPGLGRLGDHGVSVGLATAYLELSEEQQEAYKDIPLLHDFSTGCFVQPPRADNRVLQITRYAAGTEILLPFLSPPIPNFTISDEDETALRRGVNAMLPALGDIPFSSTRMGWNADTPSEDFLVTYHAEISGLFLAMGGSAYKFLPVLGEEVVDILEGLEEAKFKELWGWKDVSPGSPENWAGWKKWIRPGDIHFIA